MQINEIINVYLFIKEESYPLKTMTMSFQDYQFFRTLIEQHGLNCDNFDTTDNRIKYKLRNVDLALVKKNDEVSIFEVALTFE